MGRVQGQSLFGAESDNILVSVSGQSIAPVLHMFLSHSWKIRALLVLSVLSPNSWALINVTPWL